MPIIGNVFLAKILDKINILCTNFYNACIDNIHTYVLLIFYNDIVIIFVMRKRKQ